MNKKQEGRKKKEKKKKRRTIIIKRTIFSYNNKIIKQQYKYRPLIKSLILLLSQSLQLFQGRIKTCMKTLTSPKKVMYRLSDFFIFKVHVHVLGNNLLYVVL